MKPNKFRVWDGLKMEYNVLSGKLGNFYVSGLDENDKCSLNSFNTKYPDDIDIMQFIGLLDKKGIEIYENDIVMANGYYFANVSKRKELIYGRFPFLVQWNNMFSTYLFLNEPINKTNEVKIIEADISQRDFEIIGNIYNTQIL